MGAPCLYLDANGHRLAPIPMCMHAESGAFEALLPPAHVSVILDYALHVPEAQRYVSTDTYAITRL